MGYLGRSEGGWVSPIAVQRGGAAFLLGLSGPTVTVADEDIDHFRVVLQEGGFSEEDMQAAFALIRARHAALLDPSSHARLDAIMEENRAAEWFPLVDIKEDDVAGAPFRARTIGYDPSTYLQALGVPSYWIYGSDDRVIPVSESIARLVSIKMEPRPMITVLPGADHALAEGHYPRLPTGVGQSARLFAAWIKELEAKRRR